MAYIRRFLVNENVQQAKIYLKTKKITEEDSNYKWIRQLLKGQEGYVLWFVRQFFDNNASRDDLKNIIKRIESLGYNVFKYAETTTNDHYKSYISKMKKKNSPWMKYIPKCIPISTELTVRL